MATIIQEKPHGKLDRHQRWARFEHAELCDMSIPPCQPMLLTPARLAVPPGSYAISEDERASFIAISTQDRLRLYTRGQIEELLQKGDWTKSLLEIFSGARVTQTIKSLSQ